MTAYCGVDFHARQQTIAYCDSQDGEIKFIQLRHDDRESLHRFYTQFQPPVVVGLESGGYSDWFERFLEGIGIEAWFGNPTEIRRRARSRQKNDWRDAELLLDLLLKGEFPRGSPSKARISRGPGATTLSPQTSSVKNKGNQLLARISHHRGSDTWGTAVEQTGTP